MCGALSPHSGVTVYQALPYARSVLLEDIQLSSVLMLCLALCPLGKKQTHKPPPNPEAAKLGPGGHKWPDGPVPLARRAFARICFILMETR